MFGLASAPDLLRLLALPVLGWAAWRDLKTRRVPNRTWLPLAVLAVVLLAWDVWTAWTLGGFEWQLFAIRAAVSLGLVAPAAYLFWHFGAFGGADAKALIVLAVLFPTYPTYVLPGIGLPYETTPLGVFSLTILSNAVLVGVAYPIVLAARNATGGRFTPVMPVGWPTNWREIPKTHGRLLETPHGFTRTGLDLDALRMYLRWRGTSLAELRDNATWYRHPESLPEEPRPAGDGAVVTDGGPPEDAPPSDAVDQWGAEAFLTDVGSAYGTTPEELRAGVEVLVTKDQVWVSPGIPFIVPLFLGLVVALTYGDVLFAVLGAVGLA